MLTPAIVETISTATAKALATSGPEGINVVPVSVVKVSGDNIYLYNFFMQKTVLNLLASPEVALTCWSGLSGIQIKALAQYVTTGEVFLAAVDEMRGRFPERTLSGVIILSPRVVYDISADSTQAGVKIASRE